MSLVSLVGTFPSYDASMFWKQEGSSSAASSGPNAAESRHSPGGVGLALPITDPFGRGFPCTCKRRQFNARRERLGADGFGKVRYNAGVSHPVTLPKRGLRDNKGRKADFAFRIRQPLFLAVSANQERDYTSEREA
jgi:hypothetical protein